MDFFSMRIFLFLCILTSSLHAIFVGNPSFPHLYKNGLISSHPWVNLRVAYLYERITKGRYEDKFKSLSSTPSFVKTISQFAIGTINISHILDAYGGIGTSEMQLDNLIYAHNNFCWIAGGTITFFHYKRFSFGGDIKYFRTDQQANYFLLEQEVAPLVTPFKLIYEDIQGALGLAYKTTYFSPYIGATYLYSTIEPKPREGILRVPGTLDMVDFITQTAVTRRNWGMMLGTTLINSGKISLNLEGRFFDLTGFNFSGNLRF